MPNLVNRLLAQEYERTFGEAGGLMVVSLAGITVVEVEKLRGTLAEKGVKLRVVRNALARLALAARGFQFDDAVLSGNVAVAWGGSEAAIHVAKVVSAPEVKKSGKVALRGAVLEGNVLGAKDALALAHVPDKNTLRAQLVGCLQGPLRGLAASLGALPRGVARVLQAHAESAPSADAPSPSAAVPGEEPAPAT